jgi:AcrR family transcriptional regulator
MVEVSQESAGGARRGAPRSESARHAILDATAHLLVSRGWDRLTIEGIAAEAGVGKQTIYRWWPSRAAVVAECLREGMLLPAELVPADTADVRADLVAWLDALLRFVDDDANRPVLTALLAVAADDEGVAHLLDEVLGASSLLTRRLADALAAGDLDADTSPDVLAGAIVGAVVLHVLRRSPAAPDLPARLVRTLLH